MASPVYVRSAFSVSKRLRLNQVKSVINLVPVQNALLFSFPRVAFTTTAHNQQESLIDTMVS